MVPDPSSPRDSKRSWFRHGHLSTVIGVRLTSGQQVVVKLRRRSPRLVACSTAHRVLFERGFPCPEPLVDLEPLGEGVASAEVMIVGGETFPDSLAFRTLSPKRSLI